MRGVVSLLSCRGRSAKLRLRRALITKSEQEPFNGTVYYYKNQTTAMRALADREQQEWKIVFDTCNVGISYKVAKSWDDIAENYRDKTL